MGRGKTRKAHQARQAESWKLQQKAILAGAAKAGLAPALVQRAIAHWQRAEFDEAMECFSQARKQAPKDVVVACDYATALALRYRPAEAEAVFEELLRAGAPALFVCVKAGETFIEAQKFAVAQRYFDRAAAAADCGLGALLGLARIHERLHRLEEAAAVVERARKLAPDLPAVRLMDAVLARRRGDSPAAKAALQSLCHGPHPDAETRWKAHYELARILEDSSQHTEAFAHYTAAKALVAHEAERWAGADQAEAEFAQLIKELPADELRRWSEEEESADDLPNLALLCGYPRSGTTLVEQALNAHPNIVSADESAILGDEVITPLRKTRPDAPLANVLGELSRERIKSARKRYFDCTEIFLGEKIGPRLLLEKNPALTLSLPGILRVFPRMKLLLALRDPRDVVVSCFMQPVPVNSISRHWLTLEGAARHCAFYLRAWRTLREKWPLPFLEVKYEETVADLEGQIRRLLDLLGQPWEPAVLRWREQAETRHIHSPTYAEVLRPVHKESIGRWQAWEPQMKEAEGILAEVMSVQ